MTEQTTRPTRRPGGSDHPDVVVSLGTDHHAFDRLVRWTDDYARRRPDLRVLVQHGNSQAPARASGTPFLPGEELSEAMRSAAVVVTHGGPGTITQARAAGHLPVVVARDPELGEHVDNHQLLFVKRVEEAGRVRACTTAQQLHAFIDKALASPEDFRVDPGADDGTERAALRAGQLIDLLTHETDEATVDSAREGSATGAETTAATRTPNGTWPAVTVVVPTRDRPELLRRTLRAIVEQDYPGRITTIVVYDNDQPDPSLAHTEGDRPVRVVTNTLTPGLAGARNTGVLGADTELVAFCDDDDTWLPEKLRAQVEIMRAEPGTDMVCCGIQVVYDRVESERILDRTSVTFADLLKSRLTELHPSTFLIRRSAMIDGCGTVSEEIPGSYAEDYELLLRLARRAPIRNVPEPGVRVLWHRKSFFSERWHTISTALRWLLERYPEFALVPRGYARIAGQIAFAEAAAKRRGQALRWIGRTLRNRPLEGRSYLALLVVCGVPAGWILRLLHLRGKGV
ncbi:glycosyltransferase [Nocardiopsis metallicus]|uniref:Glycosyltransferase involved in cell wall biosynthesis/UDP-N-acetylglucosamine transferase subunit ALG13 n=1 Tax=Nocardiopsis metallicus TaxID=179819 RepID=A0A840WRZ8_9ACTN|nr:glycosyltransferase [Nocardiopsis metallicus]MBB5492908.1 glycosyltransferase involved in cell wall biosynthesis/UDP-N-acetylglucosamine transferase subunit ALG13 [Nocardiopsis metallicus]